MKKHIVKTTIFVLMAFLWSCAEGIIDQSPAVLQSKMQIMLKLPSGDEVTRAGTEAASPAEDKIENVHLFMFDSTGSKEFDIRIDFPYNGTSTDVDMSLWNSDKVIIVLNPNILANLNAARNIHVVANVAPGKLAPVTNEAELKDMLTDAIISEILQPADKALLMHGVCSGHDFTSAVRAPVTLVRNVSKLRLTVNTTDKDGITFSPGNEISFIAADVADRSYIVPGTGSNPSSTNYIDYIAKVLTMTSSLNTTKKFIAPALYVNENLNPSSPTYLMVRVPYKKGNEVLSDNYYKIKITGEDSDELVRRNTIYDITININTLGGESPQTAPEITATLNVLPWNEQTLVSDLTQTYLSVEATELRVAGGDINFRYATNAELSKRSVTSSQSWLTATLDPSNNNNLKITASGAGYTTAREAKLELKVNDLVKVIIVKQEAVEVNDGSIVLNPQTIYLSSAHPARNVGLSVAPTSSSWSNLMSNANVATYTPVGGTGNATLTFTRGATLGNATFRYFNQTTLHYADLDVCNLALTSSATELQIPGGGVSNGTEPGIVASGGDAQWVVKSKPDWVTVSNSGGNLIYSVPQVPTEGMERSGTIVLAHINDGRLTVSISVKQSARYVVLDPFEYMVITYDWSKSTGVDLDSATEFANIDDDPLTNDTPLSNVFPNLSLQPLGYNLGSHVFIDKARVYEERSTGYNNDANLILRWGGDNRARAGTENIVWYMTRFRTERNLTALRAKNIRYVYIDMYAMWYSSADTNTKIKLSIKTYVGGEMVRNSSSSYGDVVYGTFTNQINGVVQPQSNAPLERELYLTDSSGSSSSFRTTYTKMVIIRYDIEKNETSMTLAGSNTRSAAMENYVIDPDYPQLLPDESKEEHTKRVDQYYKNRK